MRLDRSPHVRSPMTCTQSLLVFAPFRGRIARCAVLTLTAFVSQTTSPAAAFAETPEGATLRTDLSSDDVQVFGLDNTLWLQLAPGALARKQADIPRLCAPLREMKWNSAPDAELKIVPEPDHWRVSWKSQPSDSSVIELVFDAPPILPGDCPRTPPAGDGSVLLRACQARTTGEKLRYEPQWYKNTVGYWTIPSDYAAWRLSIEQPGTYSVAVLQGCGAGQGGSDAVLDLRQDDQVIAKLPFQTVETGHFQNFRWHHLGHLSVDQRGDCELRITPTRIAKNALFDVRMVHLVRQAAAP